MHASRYFHRFAPLVVAACAACAPETPLPGSEEAIPATAEIESASEVARIQPGDTLFVSFAEAATERFTIPFIYMNFRADTLFHPTCRPDGGAPTVAVALERRVDGEWIHAWSQAQPACLSEPLVIPPGGRFRDTLEVRLHPQDATQPPHMNPAVAVDGTYRMVWHALLSSYDPNAPPFGETIDFGERISAPFELRRGAGIAARGEPDGLDARDSLVVSRRDTVWEYMSIPFTYRNVQPDTLYQPTCRSEDGTPGIAIGLERRVAGEWRYAWSPVLNECLSDPIVIPPGGRFVGTLEVRLHESDTTLYPSFHPGTDIDGTYRLAWYSLLRTYDADAYPFGVPANEGARVSAPFRIRR